MKKRLLLTILLIVAGCQPARQAAIDISIENVKNAETMRDISHNCISTWQIQSGFIKGALGSRMNELPNEVIEAIEELDNLAEKQEKSDYELGYFLGLKARLWSSVIQVALEKYARDMIGVIPLVF